MIVFRLIIAWETCKYEQMLSHRWHLEWPCMKRRLLCSSNETDWFTACHFMACVVLLHHKSQTLSVLLSNLKVKYVAEVNRPQSRVWLFCSCCWFTLQTVVFFFVFLFSTFFLVPVWTPPCSDVFSVTVKPVVVVVFFFLIFVWFGFAMILVNRKLWIYCLLRESAILRGGPWSLELWHQQDVCWPVLLRLQDQSRKCDTHHTGSVCRNSSCTHSI